MLELEDRVVKAAIVNIFKDLKETKFKELKENIGTKTYQIENNNEDKEIIFFKKRRRTSRICKV